MGVPNPQRTSYSALYMCVCTRVLTLYCVYNDAYQLSTVSSSCSVRHLNQYFLADFVCDKFALMSESNNAYCDGANVQVWIDLTARSQIHNIELKHDYQHNMKIHLVCERQHCLVDRQSIVAYWQCLSHFYSFEKEWHLTKATLSVCCTAKIGSYRNKIMSFIPNKTFKKVDIPLC